MVIYLIQNRFVYRQAYQLFQVKVYFEFEQQYMSEIPPGINNQHKRVCLESESDIPVDPALKQQNISPELVDNQALKIADESQLKIDGKLAAIRQEHQPQIQDQTPKLKISESAALRQDDQSSIPKHTQSNMSQFNLKRYKRKKNGKIKIFPQRKFFTKQPAVYNFESQIKLLQNILQTNISLVQSANILLQKMSIDVIKAVIKELKKQYEEKYYKTNRTKFHKINAALHQIYTNHATDLDLQFMKLAFIVNQHYLHKHIDVRKRINYIRHCRYCLKYVSNAKMYLNYHERSCDKIDRIKNIKIQGRKQTKFVKAKEYSYEIGQIYKLQCKLYNAVNFDHFDQNMIYIRQEDDNLYYEESQHVKAEYQQEKQQEQEEEEEHQEEEAQENYQIDEQEYDSDQDATDKQQMESQNNEEEPIVKQEYIEDEDSNICEFIKHLKNSNHKDSFIVKLQPEGP